MIRKFYETVKSLRKFTCLPIVTCRSLRCKNVRGCSDGLKRNAKNYNTVTAWSYKQSIRSYSTSKYKISELSERVSITLSCNSGRYLYKGDKNLLRSGASFFERSDKSLSRFIVTLNYGALRFLEIIFSQFTTSNVFRTFYINIKTKGNLDCNLLF